MDDPNLIPNSTVEQKGKMTSVSPPKRTIVLGVVNTTGMKSTNLNRKRRWDQPPDEVSDIPCVKKVHLSDCTDSEIESPETTPCVNPILDRISERNSDLSNKCDILNSKESESHLEQLSRSENVPCEISTTPIDVPSDNVSDRLSNVNEDISSNLLSCSNENECKSTVPTQFSDSVCDKKMNSFSPELRLDTTSSTVEIEEPVKSINEKQKTTSSVKKIKSSTVISHQSEELRRIMFSYDEGSSDSDISDSNTASSNVDGSDKILNEVTDQLESDINIDAVDIVNENVENINVPSNQSEALEPESKKLPFTDSETDSNIAGIVDSNKETLPNETGAFINEISTNVSDDKTVHESLFNIPNQKEAELKSNNEALSSSAAFHQPDQSPDSSETDNIQNSIETVSDIEIPDSKDIKKCSNAGTKEVCDNLTSKEPSIDVKGVQEEIEISTVIEESTFNKYTFPRNTSIQEGVCEQLKEKDIESSTNNNILQTTAVVDPSLTLVEDNDDSLSTSVNKDSELQSNLVDEVLQDTDDIQNDKDIDHDEMKDNNEDPNSDYHLETFRQKNVLNIASTTPIDSISLENLEKEGITSSERGSKGSFGKCSVASPKDVSAEESEKVSNDILQQGDIASAKLKSSGSTNDCKPALLEDNVVEMNDSNLDDVNSNTLKSSKVENIFCEAKDSSSLPERESNDANVIGTHITEHNDSGSCDMPLIINPKEDDNVLAEDLEKSVNTSPLNNNVLPAEIKDQAPPETSLLEENMEFASQRILLPESGPENVEENAEKTSLSSDEQLSVHLNISKSSFEEKSFKITNRSIDESEKSSIVSSSKNIDPEVMEVIFGSTSDHQRITDSVLEEECLSVPSADSDSNIETNINLLDSNSPLGRKEDSVKDDVEEVRSHLNLEASVQKKMELENTQTYESSKSYIEKSLDEKVLEETSLSVIVPTDCSKEDLNKTGVSKTNDKSLGEVVDTNPNMPTEVSPPKAFACINVTEEKSMDADCSPISSTKVLPGEVGSLVPENKKSFSVDKVVNEGTAGILDSTKEINQSEKDASSDAMQKLITDYESENTEDGTAEEIINSSKTFVEAMHSNCGELKKEDKVNQGEIAPVVEISSLETKTHEARSPVETTNIPIEPQSKQLLENNSIKLAEENISSEGSSECLLASVANTTEAHETTEDFTSLKSPLSEATSEFETVQEKIINLTEPQESVISDEIAVTQSKVLESEKVSESFEEPESTSDNFEEISLSSGILISDSQVQTGITNDEVTVDRIKSQDASMNDTTANDTVIEGYVSSEINEATESVGNVEMLESKNIVAKLEDNVLVEKTNLIDSNESEISERRHDSLKNDNNIPKVFSNIIIEEQCQKKIKDTVNELPSCITEVKFNEKLNPEDVLEEEADVPEIDEGVFVVSEKHAEEKSESAGEKSTGFISEISEIEDDFKTASQIPPPFESELTEILDDSKDFEESVDIPDPIALLSEEANLEPVETSLVTIEDEVLIGETKSTDVELTERINSPIETRSDISFEPMSNIITVDSNKVLNEEIESYDVDVVEEVVTCESPESDKMLENELEDIIEDDDDDEGNARSPSLASEETLETVQEPNSDQLEAVIENDTSDLKESELDNQNEVFIESEVCIRTESFSSEQLGKGIREDKKGLGNEVMINSISNEFPSRKRDSSSGINSITKPETSLVDEEMEVDETSDVSPPGNKKRRVNNTEDTAYSSVINTVNTDSKVLKDIGSSDIPLLKTLSSPIVQKQEVKYIQKEEAKKPENIQESRLEPITLRIYKDNLSIKTDDLDSPKRNRSPKLSSEIRSQQSPQSKAAESVCTLSPQNKQLEFTLKIAKDVNTNKPKATMSPKRNMSPSSSWKLETGSLSPGSPGDPLKIKISRPISPVLIKDTPIFDKTIIKEEIDVDSTRLPTPTIEIGSALKKIMESEKIEVKKEGSILEQALSNSSNDSPSNSLLAKKRGRPRKILLPSGEDEGNPLNHSPTPPMESPSLDTSGESEQGSSRQVRSCRARTQPIVVKTRKPRGGGVGRGGGRGGAKGVARPITSEKEAEKIQEKLSEYEKAELAKIEARKEKMRLDRIAKNEAKKAKKLAKKLKDEERRKRIAAEKAEKAAAAAPQVFEEETRMSAPDSRGHTPAPASALARLNQISETPEESQNSINTPNSANKKGRMEIPMDPESDEVRVDQLAEYQWQGSELCMIQEQVSLYLGVKSFKRKYPDLKRRLVEAEERTFLEDSGLVPKSMCDLGLTAVSSAEVLDVMYHDFPDKYEEFRGYMREKESRELSFRQKALSTVRGADKSKGEPREQALEAVAMWNLNLNRERREERRCALDLQTFTVHYPKTMRDKMVRPALRPGLYPVPVIPGQFSDYYKTYTPTELMYFPLNTVMYGPLKPNERRPNHSDGSDSSSSSSDDSSCGSESEDEENVSKECKICNGEKKTNSETHPEILLQCSQCKGLCHPTCQEITPEMLPHIKKYSWHCSNCKRCVQCKNATKEDKMLFCDLCDRGYHLNCVGLKKSPEGRWHCSVCSFCTICGSKDPGGAEWHYEYKKTEKGVRLYQRTLCVPCSKNALL